MTSAPHRFRFFIEDAGAPGLLVTPSEDDLKHLRVLRLDEGDEVDVVDVAGALWLGRVRGEQLELAAGGSVAPDVQGIELVAGALVGGRFDELVEGAVQAGADRITPLVTNRRDAERLASRTSRLRRIARSAAKQSKRSIIPHVDEPIDEAALLSLVPGIVLDAGAEMLLDAQLEARSSRPLRLLVGPAEGVDPELLRQLTERGWAAARLGPTVLRSELAAAVAVAVAAMRTSRV